MKKISRKFKIIGIIFALSFVTGFFFTNCQQRGFATNTAAIDSGGGADPLLELAWHLSNHAQRVFATSAATAGVDLNLMETWKSGINGEGIKILISDDGVDDTHEDLTRNFLYSGVSKNYQKGAPYLSMTSRPLAKEDNHGTAVAGLVAAAYGNGVGSSGVAPGAMIASANFMSDYVLQTESQFIDQASGDFDIFNMSWGASQNNLVPPDPFFERQLEAGVRLGRAEKGSVYVKAAGNDFFVPCRATTTNELCTGNSNFDGDNINPFLVLTTALNSSGKAASYASMGANIWISSFGGENNSSKPAILTTDRSGCQAGYSFSGAISSLNFQKGGEGNANCNYTSTFSGTSAAAPILTGVVALIMQANPQLSWRDIKYILAKTALPIEISPRELLHPLESIPEGADWEVPFITNAAGFKFQNFYGFGRVNVDAAVALAKNYDQKFGPLRQTSFVDVVNGLNQEIPDSSSIGTSSAISVSSHLRIEAVQVKLNVTHPDISDLAIELTSPSGTRSIVVNMNNSLRKIANYEGDIFLTNAFYGENSQGEWKIKIIDGKAPNVGQLHSWSLNFYGSD